MACRCHSPGAHGMRLPVAGGPDLLEHRLAVLIDLLHPERFDAQAGFRHGAAAAGPQGVKGAHRMRRPVEADRANPAVFTRLPLGGRGGIRAHRNLSAQAVGHLFRQLDLAEAGPPASARINRAGASGNN